MAAGAFCGLIAIVSAVGLLSLAGWFLSATAFAGLTLAGAKLFNFFMPSVGVRIFAILRTLARYAERIVSHDATFRILSGLRRWFYTHLEPLGPARLMTFRSGDLLNRITADIDALDNLYLRVLSPSLVAALMVVIVALFLNIFDTTVAASFCVFMVLAGCAGPIAAGRAGADAGKDLALKVADLRIRIVEGTQGLAELLVFHAEDYHLERLDHDNRKLIQVQQRMARIRGLSIAWVTLLAGLSVLTALYLGSELVNTGKLAGANLALICMAVLASYEAVLMLPAAFQYLGQTREAGRRLLEIVDAVPEVVFPQQSELKPGQFALEFEGVDFCYHPQAPPAVESINFKVEDGQQVAIVGETGSGKSTLVNLLVRFWNPRHGKISIGGRDISTLSEIDLRQSLAVVSQQAHLFNATIRDNLMLARPEATEDELCDALTVAGMLEFVEQLSDGLDTWVGESGRLLSGGQARRLAVARAVLYDAPIWILDEPTEGLDTITERKMMERLFDHTRGRTMLLITHRLVALDRMDRILVMERGRIVEQGTHKALLKGDTRYAAMLARINV
jgi:ATP-binding cassette subfamily C protein CydC